MYIKKVYIHNFGKFHHKTVYFSPGLNVVYGENESGKSTLQGFLTGMLFGMEKQRGRAAAGGQKGMGAYQRYEPWNTASYYAGSMEFVVADREFTIERNFYHKEKTVRLYNPGDGEELSVEHGDLDMLLGGVGKGFYENTCCIAQASVVTESCFAAQLQQELANRVHGGEPGTDIGQALKLLGQRRRQEEQRLKAVQQRKAELKNRLEWEQELLWKDVRQLQQKLASAEAAVQEHGEAAEAAAQEHGEAAEAAAQEHGEAANPQKAAAGEPHEGILFRIPVIGWLLRLLRWVYRRITGEAETRKEPTETRQKPAETGQESAEPAGKAERFSLDILKEQLEEKQTRLINVEEELEEAGVASGEERELQSRLKSIRLAEETLDQVAKESFQDGRDDIQAAVSGIFSGITGGKYDRVEVTEEGQVLLWDEEKPLSPWQLSRGAMEQLYFALRLGAGRCMMQEEPLPVLLDETFCAYDDLRLRRTLQWLADQQEQMILFTCQKRELLLLEELGIVHHRILL